MKRWEIGDGQMRGDRKLRRLHDAKVSEGLQREQVHFPTDSKLRTNGNMYKSETSSFGNAILQLLTRRPPVELESEVRRAMLSGELTSILDPLAGGWPMFVAMRLAELAL
ncbi:hypothetical protein Syun_021216 [Stephania yunnanensis]|uniref:RING-type E3 ubiquitin transferase n=1 Tax=Stephania yunnanensis TaxID=152371 RepID=A0AAP0IF83_9MAGN